MASILDSIFGSKPQIADYESLDFSQEQLDALMGDLAAFPEISKLGAGFQKSYLDELNTAIPGFSDILAEGGTLTQQMQSIAGTELSGELPPDVAEQVQRSSAFQNLKSGAGGSMASANTARNYGVTSLDLINQGANLAGNAAQRWGQLATASGAGGAQNIMAGMLQTPQQRAEFDKQQNLIKQAVQQAKYNVAAAPNPALQALNQWIEQVGGTIVSAYATGGMSKGGDFKTTGGPTAAEMPNLASAYASAGSPSPVFGSSGYPSAIPAGGYGSGLLGDPGGTTTGPSSVNDTFTLPSDVTSQVGAANTNSSLLNLGVNPNAPSMFSLLGGAGTTIDPYTGKPYIDFGGT